MAEQMSQEQVGESLVDMVLGQSAPVDVPQPQKAPVVQAPDAVEEPAQADAPVEAQEQAEDVETIEIDPDAELFDQELEENGQKIQKKLSLRELQKGYLRQADYTRKTQDLAKQRAEVQEQVRQAAMSSSKDYSQKLDQLQAAVVKAIAPELTNVDWNKLATEDAFEYVRLSNRARQIQETLQAVESEKKSLADKSAQEERQRKLEAWAKTEATLRQDIPDWGTDVVQKLAKAAREAGATDAEVNELDKAWIIKLAHKAALYDQGQSKTETAVKKVAVVTKTLKPGMKAPNRNAEAEKIAAWKKSGSKINELGADIFSKYV